MESTASRMHRLGRSVLMGTPLLSLDEMIARLDAVDARAAQELARDFYRAGVAVRRRDRARRGDLPGARSGVSTELAAA